MAFVPIIIIIILILSKEKRERIVSPNAERISPLFSLFSFTTKKSTRKKKIYFRLLTKTKQKKR